MTETNKAALTTVTNSDAGSILAVITRVSTDPNVNVEKIERLVALYRQMKADEARGAYLSALAEMQPALPVIERNGRITVYEKGKPRTPDNLIQSTPYALWDDINEAIKPSLQKYGFTLSFRTGTAPDGKVSVTGILGHKDGHQEETTIALPHDSTGSKNAVQAVGSSTSYGKRYAAGALLNLTFKGEDDDGVAGGTATLTEAQISTLRGLIVDTAADLPRFLKHFGVTHLDALPADQFAKALHMLEEKARAGKGAK